MADKTKPFAALTLGSRSALKLLAAEIQAACKARGWTEADLAERAGCSRRWRRLNLT
ncbi:MULTISPECIES: hypothetical protein [Shinella]|jgi:hypothetical protein|uniref:hypothetical protein n=1 Tax=Shinella TaxID=323620 RepID=UPI001F41AD4B|nr:MULTISPECIES: hypothetical protein [Shinella]MCW5711542.1 hypothetical protein [Shinella sp.]